MPPKRGVTRSGQTPSKKAKIAGTPEKESSDGEVQAPSSTPRKSSREWQPTSQNLESIADKAPAKKKKTLATVEAQKAARAGRASPTKVSGRKPPADRGSSKSSSSSSEKSTSEKSSSKKSSSSTSSSSSETSSKQSSKKSSSTKSTRSNNNNKDTEEKEETQPEQEEKNTKKSSSKKSSRSSGAAEADEQEEKNTKKSSSKKSSRSSAKADEQEEKNTKKSSSKKSSNAAETDEQEEKNTKKPSAKKSSRSSKAAEAGEEEAEKSTSKKSSRSSKDAETDEQEEKNTKKPSSKKSRSSKSAEAKDGAEEQEEKAPENEEKKGAGKGKKGGPGRGKTSGEKEPEEKKDTSVQGPGKMEQLHPDTVPKLTAYRKSRAFDAQGWINAKCKMFNDYMTKCGLKACVVSLSGGVDSAVTLALMNHASKMKGSSIEKVAAIAQPIKSSAWALNRARECADGFGIEMYVVDQTELHSELQALVDKAVGIEGKNFATGQLRSYMRTPVGYYVAQLISQKGQPCVVMGTGNMDEDGYLAYFCKAGDGVVDIQLIADLHKSEVFAVGKELGVPDSILVAPPSADLWEGHTDEEELGFTYDFVELFTGHFNKLSVAEQKKFVASLSKPAKEQWGRWCEACIKVHNRNKHKIGGPKNLNVIEH